MATAITQLPGHQTDGHLFEDVVTATDLTAAPNQATGRGVVVGATGVYTVAGANAFVAGVIDEVLTATSWRIRYPTGAFKVRSAGTIAEAVALTTDASGDFTAAATGERASCRAVEAAGAVNEATQVIAQSHIAL